MNLKTSSKTAAKVAAKFKEPPVVIGWNEYVSLPAWGIPQLRAKIDTGARTASVHVEHIEELGGGKVRFDVITGPRARPRRKRIEARISRRANVRIGSGHRQQRLFVRTTLRLGPFEREIEVNLEDRAGMIFRMILGRSTLAGWPVVIDVNHRYVLPKQPRRKGKNR